MLRVLLDENIPIGLRRLLDRGEDVRHFTELGWDGAANGALLTEAERAGFAVLVTADRNLRYRRNMKGWKLALVIVSTNRWRELRANLDAVTRAIGSSIEGGYVELDLGRHPASGNEP